MLCCVVLMGKRPSIGRRQCKSALGQNSPSPQSQKAITSFLQPKPILTDEVEDDIEDDETTTGFIVPTTLTRFVCCLSLF